MAKVERKEENKINKTQIEWVKNPDGSQGYTWNPITGCLNHDNGLCKGGGFPCYAYRLAHGRLKQRYLNGGEVAEQGYEPSQLGDPFYPRLWEDRLYHPWGGKPKGIFVCDMGDLFGIGIPESWTNRVLEELACYPEQRFYLLTKQPQNLIKFSPFPENCWVGVTATNGKMVDDAGYYLEQIQASVKYLSLEPLLEPIQLYFGKPGINWLIIGACTGTAPDMGALIGDYEDLTLMHWHEKTWTAQPKMEWVKEIVEAADKAGTSVFLKNNLKPLLKAGAWQIGDHKWMTELRQELPKGR